VGGEGELMKIKLMIKLKPKLKGKLLCNLGRKRGGRGGVCLHGKSRPSPLGFIKSGVQVGKNELAPIRGERGGGTHGGAFLILHLLKFPFHRQSTFYIALHWTHLN